MYLGLEAVCMISSQCQHFDSSNGEAKATDSLSTSAPVRGGAHQLDAKTQKVEG